MENPAIPHAAAPAGPPWRMLILDSSPEDPKWLLATVTVASDVRAAVMEGHRYADWPAFTEWVHQQVGRPVSLVPVSAVAWRVDES